VSASVPALLVAPGFGAAQIVAEPPLTLPSLARARADALVQPDRPHRVVIPCAGDLRLELAPSRFSLVELERGKVLRMRSTLQLGHATLREAQAIVRGASGSLSSAGFEQRSEDDVAGALESCDRARLSSWHLPRAGWRGELWLRRVVRANTPLAAILRVGEDAYLVTLVLDGSC
jgi:hypothetical protein